MFGDFLNLFNSDANESVLDRRLGNVELPGAVALHPAAAADGRREVPVLAVGSSDLLKLFEPLSSGREPRVELQHAAESLRRLDPLVLPRERQPEVVGVLRVGGIPGGGFAKGLFAAGQVSAAAKHHPE